MAFAKAASEKEIKEIKRIHRKLFFAFILIILAVPSIGFVDTFLKSDTVSISFAIIYIGFLGWLFLSFNLSKCPRCTKLFFYSSWPSGINKCSSCGLSIKETKSKKRKK